LDFPDAPGREVPPGETVIVKICILATSSAGNCTFVSSGRTRILVDAGLSRKTIFERLAQIGEDPSRVDAILVSHEHTDHVAGLPLIVKQLGCPVYVSHLTAPALAWGNVEPQLVPFEAGSVIEINDIRVQTFTVPHDAADPVGFCLEVEGKRLGLVTDLGYLPQSVRYHLHGVDFLLLEANHDTEMLKVGPYPWPVKQRVMSRKGHLSNDLVAEYLATELDPATHTLVLGHLSEHNNHPELVRLSAEQALGRRGLKTRLVVVKPREISPVFEF